MYKLINLLTVLITMLLICSAVESVNAQSSKYFPDDCWGVYSWAGWKPETVSRESHPLIKGAPMILKWNDLEPEEGQFRFEEKIGQKLKLADENGFYTFLMVWVAPNAPRWLYENGVPEVKMTPTINPLGKPRNWTFQYYLDDDYIYYYHRMLSEFGAYIMSLPENLRKRVLFIQSAEGSTGDGGGYKGKPLDNKYDLNKEDWGDFRIDAWKVLKKAVSNKKGELVIPLLVNYDSNSDKQYNWLLNNLPVIGLKNGMFSHGYHISDTKKRIANWESFKHDVESHDMEFFSRGEQDAEWKVYGWSTQNTKQAFYWSGIFATHCGIDMWNVPADASNGYHHQDAINFFNRYAGQRNPALAKSAFCALRKGLDASDTHAYPEAIYGEAVKNNISRYLKIADSYKTNGAKQGDPDKAIGGGMINRKRQDYNDVGWGIHDGNYSRFISQINPESTSNGWWHKGPPESVYSRFARSINTENNNNAIYFDVDDSFSDDTKNFEVRIVWLDEGTATWTLCYGAITSNEKVALSIKNTNSGEWKEKTIHLRDASFKNNCENAADILIRTDGSDQAVFHLIELNKK
jgi:hypothetical protein